MSKIVPQYDLTQIKDPTQFMRFASDVISQIVNALNGKLDFANLSTQQVGVTFKAPNVSVGIPHNLDKTGVNYIVVSTSGPCEIFRGSGDTDAQVFLQSSAGGINATLILY